MSDLFDREQAIEAARSCGLVLTVDEAAKLVDAILALPPQPVQNHAPWCSFAHEGSCPAENEAEAMRGGEVPMPSVPQPVVDRTAEIYEIALQEIVNTDPSALDALKVASKALGDASEHRNTGTVKWRNPPSPPQPVQTFDREQAIERTLRDVGEWLSGGDITGYEVVLRRIENALALPPHPVQITDRQFSELHIMLCESIEKEPWGPSLDELRQMVGRALSLPREPAKGDCPACGAPEGFPPAGPCINHGTVDAVLPREPGGDEEDVQDVLDLMDVRDLRPREPGGDG